MNQLFQTVRSRCSRANWSRGAQLARGGAVVVQSSDNGEIALSVAQKGSLAVNVTLYPEQRDWECSCDSTEEVCQHAAAAVIAVRALKRAGVGAEAQGQARPGHVGYRFERQDGRLTMRRTIVLGKHEAPFTTTLAEVIQGKHNGPPVHASETDRKAELAMGSYTGGAIPLSLMPRLLDALSDAADIRYNGRPVRIGKPVSGLCVRVEECGLGFRLRLDQDPAVNEVFQNGALRRGIKLRAVIPHGLGERRFMELRAGKIYEESEIGTLVGEVLPKLQLQIPVVVDTPKLPKVETVKPRLQLTSEREPGDKLTLLAVIVYGDPPRARVDGDRLTLLSGREVPVRDIEAELPLKRMADGLGLELGFRRTFTGVQAIAVARRMTEITDTRVFIQGEGHKEFYESDPLTPKLELKDNGDFDLWFEPVGISQKHGSDDPRRADPYAVLRAWEQGNPLVPLLGGGFSRLPDDWLSKFGHRVRDLLAAREAMADSNDGKAAKALMPDLAALAESLEMPPPAEFKKLRTLLDSFEGIPSAKLPAGVKATLRDYQKRGYDWLTFLRDTEMGALLADDMGLGKTLQTLCALKGRTLVVAPTSVLHNWATEISRFRPSLKVNLYHGPNRALEKRADVTLTTYAILRLDQELLAAEAWDTVVVDEAQAIKNPTSQVAKAAFGLNAKFRVALTGTPVENRLEDLWSQFHFINRGLLGGRQDFNDRYVKPIAAGDPEAAARLRQRIRPFVLRRMKSEVAKELPPRTEVVLRCELSDTERQVYDAVRAATRADVLKKLSGDANATLAVLEALLRLRQAACHPALLPGQKRFESESSSKLDLLIELLEEALAEGHKALVFSQWTSLLDLVGQQFDKHKIGFTRLDGSTKDRKAVVDEFQDPAGPKVILISLKAGGTGLNLTAADHVVLLDPWWNPAVEDQAADRAHRIGQTRPVIVHRLVAEDTVEDRILKLQESKRGLAAAALGDAAAASSVTRDELLALLE
jgi:superfamily II DNA or RNA helicase